MRELGLRHAGADALKDSSAPVLEWIANEGVEHLTVHVDIDVIDPKRFSPIIFN